MQSYLHLQFYILDIPFGQHRGHDWNTKSTFKWKRQKGKQGKKVRGQKSFFEIFAGLPWWRVNLVKYFLYNIGSWNKYFSTFESSLNVNFDETIFPSCNTTVACFARPMPKKSNLPKKEKIVWLHSKKTVARTSIKRNHETPSIIRMIEWRIQWKYNGNGVMFKSLRSQKWWNTVYDKVGCCSIFIF